MNVFAKLLFVGLTLVGASSASAAYTLSNSAGGDGFLTGAYPSFTLSGADDGPGYPSGYNTNFTYYTDTVAASGLLTFNWNYVTDDCCGAGWDPAGYVINGVNTQLTADVFGPPGTGNASGTTTVALGAGDFFGWYVYSPDSCCGRGNLSVTDVSVTAVPEPETYALMLAGLGLLGFMARRRKQHEAA
jgi:hypothetical protein